MIRPFWQKLFSDRATQSQQGRTRKHAGVLWSRHENEYSDPFPSIMIWREKGFIPKLLIHSEGNALGERWVNSENLQFWSWIYHLRNPQDFLTIFVNSVFCKNSFSNRMFEIHFVVLLAWVRWLILVTIIDYFLLDHLCLKQEAVRFALWKSNRLIQENWPFSDLRSLHPKLAIADPQTSVWLRRPSDVHICPASNPLSIEFWSEVWRLWLSVISLREKMA